MKFPLMLLAAAALFVGCQSYPMGLNETQWKALTPEQQADYTRQQAVINEERRQKREAEERARQAAAEAKAAEERQRVEMAYARARYGDVVTVTVEGGQMAISGKLLAYEPVRFDLVRGERKEIEFVQQGRSSNVTKVDVRLSEDGNMLYFDEAARGRITLISKDWETGKTMSPLTIQDRGGRPVAVGTSLTVKYKSLPGGPRRVIVLPPPK